MPGPSLAEVRELGQPRSVVDRLNDEHWAGRLYMRRLSPYVVWLLARTSVTPNMVTVAFVLCGIAAGVVVAFGGLATAIAGAVLVQLYLLGDCADGELARWSRRFSAKGLYLDLAGPYLAESAMLAGLGFRAQGEFATAGPYITAGIAAALLAMLVKAETDIVIVVRAKSGLPASHSDEALTPTKPALASMRRLASVLRVHRITQAVELSLLILIAAIIDSATGTLTATRVLTLACLVVAGLMVVAHLVAILTSGRLA